MLSNEYLFPSFKKCALDIENCNAWIGRSRGNNDAILAINHYSTT